MQKSRYTEMAKRYAEQVVLDEILACRWVQSACQRRLHDLIKFKENSNAYRFNAKFTRTPGVRDDVAFRQI